MHKQLKLIKPGTRRQLICFHFAGGNAEYFMPWRDHTDDHTAVYAVQLAGRGHRLSEKLKTCLHQCADEVAQSLSFLPHRPTSFFGHSMGAALAFETAIRWEQQGRKLAHFFASGRIPPHKNRGTNYHKQSDDALVDKIMGLGGTSEVVFDNPALRKLMLPIIRADFEAIESYQRDSLPTLSCPLSALLGEGDTEVTESEILDWSLATVGEFDFQRFSGGHFYLNNLCPTLFDYLKNKMS